MVALLPATQNRARLAIPGMVLGMYLCGLCRNQAARNDDYWPPPSSDLRRAPAGSGPRTKLWGIDTDNTEFHGPASIMTFERRLRSKASGVSWFLIDRVANSKSAILRKMTFTRKTGVERCTAARGSQRTISGFTKAGIVVRQQRRSLLRQCAVRCSAAVLHKSVQ